MDKTEEQVQLTPEQQHQQDLERIKLLRPIDDTLMREIFRGELKLVEKILRIITNKPDLEIISSETQFDMKHIFGERSITLDVHAKDSTGKIYNFEVQKDNSGATPQRARYHSSALDVEYLPSKTDFVNLPDTYVIFITERDVRKRGRAIYLIERMDVTTGELFNDGEHIIFVNGAYHNPDDDSDLAKLIHDFKCSDADQMYLPELAEKTRYLKVNPKGVEQMCKIMEEMREDIENRKAIQFAIKLLVRGKETLEEIAEDSGLSLEKVKELASQISVSA